LAPRRWNCATRPSARYGPDEEARAGAEAMGAGPAMDAGEAVAGDDKAPHPVATAAGGGRHKRAVTEGSDD